MKREELKPCPFCGYAGHFYHIKQAHGYRVTCGECDASSWLAGTEELAIKGWNTGVSNKQKG